MRLNITQIVLQFILILTTYRQGILVVVYAYSALNILWLFAWQVYAHRMIGVRLLDVLKDTLPFALISVAVMAVVYIITQPLSNIYLLLFVRVILAALAYMGIMKLFRVKIMDECIGFLIKKKH